jgi:hypothetical protein
MIKKNKRFQYNPRYNLNSRSYFNKKTKNHNSNIRIIIILIILFLLTYFIITY